MIVTRVNKFFKIMACVKNIISIFFLEFKRDLENENYYYKNGLLRFFLRFWKRTITIT